MIHLLTGLGLIAGLFALISVMNNNQKEAFLWLGVAFLIDSVDGTLESVVGQDRPNSGTLPNGFDVVVATPTYTTNSDL